MAEVEFVDEKGSTSALVTLEKNELIRLRMDVVSA